MRLDGWAKRFVCISMIDSGDENEVNQEESAERMKYVRILEDEPKMISQS